MVKPAKDRLTMGKQTKDESTGLKRSNFKWSAPQKRNTALHLNDSRPNRDA